ncbi:TPA: CDP-alcohol phosphatidyltransferase family protein [Candidatus Poribacteria bacterium]|nr:CDP-alcohol phosphatidyltransferase family protein [Candidatus Poribacteria bacterium]
MEGKGGGNAAKIAVNLVTASRIPIAIAIYENITARRFLLALILLVIGETADWIDGTMARRLNAKTRFGAAFEHVADGFMMGMVWLGFVRTGLLPLWLFALGLFYCLITWLLPLKFTNRFLGMAAGFRTMIYGVTLAAVPIILIFNISNLKLRYSILALLVGYSIPVLIWKRDRIAIYWRYLRTGEEKE